jgi:hypothetical protein
MNRLSIAAIGLLTFGLILGCQPPKPETPPPLASDATGTVQIDWASHGITEQPVVLALGQTLEVGSLRYTPEKITVLEQNDPTLPHFGGLLALQVKLENTGEIAFSPEHRHVRLVADASTELLEARLLDPAMFDLPLLKTELDSGATAEDTILVEFSNDISWPKEAAWVVMVNPDPDTPNEFRRLPVAIAFRSEIVKPTKNVATQSE